MSILTRGLGTVALVVAGFGPINPLVAALTVNQAVLNAGADAGYEQVMRQTVEWDDREIIELLTIIMKSGILK